MKVGQGLNSPSRSYYWEFIAPFAQKWSGKNILDIGSGTGWLLDLASKAGVKSAIGIEPSSNNISAGKKLYPNVTQICTTFERYIPDRQFNCAVAIFTLTNIADPALVFARLSNLLYKKGEFLTIVPDYDFYKQPRWDYKIEIESLNDSEYSALVTKPDGMVTADIIREIKVYESLAKKNHLKLIQDIPMKPTKTVMTKIPKYKEFGNTAMTHLLRFVRED